MKSISYQNKVESLSSVSILWIGNKCVKTQSKIQSFFDKKICKTNILGLSSYLSSSRNKTIFDIVVIEDGSEEELYSAVDILLERELKIPIIYIDYKERLEYERSGINIHYVKHKENVSKLLWTISTIKLGISQEYIDTKQVIEDILDINPTFLMLLNEQLKIEYLNKKALFYLHLKTIDDFYTKATGLCNFITKLDNKPQNLIDDKLWLKVILNQKEKVHTISLKAYRDNTERLFVVNHTYIKSSKQHIISLTEVTEILQAKDEIINDLELDSLTKLYGRSKFIKLCLKTIADRRIESKANATSVIFFDIDDFKTINDTYGHITGDEVLSALGNIITESIRGEDIASRWGGDEFIILTSSSKEAANIQAERLRQRIEKSPLTAHNLNITCSFGITDLKAGEDYNDAISRADKAMYKSKRSGKNTVNLI